MLKSLPIKGLQAFQAANEAPSLAMSFLTDKTRTNQGTHRVMERERALDAASKPRKATSRKAVAKPVVTPLASTLKFWAAQEGSQRSKEKNKSNGKRKHRAK